MKSFKNFLIDFDYFLIFLLALTIIIYLLKIFPQGFDDVFGTIVSLLATIPVLISTYKALRTKKITVDLLASIALILSLISREIFSSIFINLMLTTARIFQSYTDNKTKASINHLLKLKPVKTRIKIGDEIKEIPIRKLKVGDLVVVELGERIPIDGKIVQGEATIDQSSLTGESLPIDKTVGDDVLSSTLVSSGSLVVEAVKVGKTTTLEKIIRLVNEYQSSKAPITSIADKFAQGYIIAIFIVIILLYLATHNLDLILSVVLVVCADDIAIAIPLAFLGGIRAAARFGAIIKGSRYLEGISNVKTLVVDKTGTLTVGKLSVEKIYLFNNFQKEEVLKSALSLMNHSNHPIAKAIRNYSKQFNITLKNNSTFEEFKGLGVKAEINGKTIYIGKKDFIENNNIKFGHEVEDRVSKIQADGLNATLIAIDGTMAAVISLMDKLKENIPDLFIKLKGLGVNKIIMLTGDNEKIAENITNESGLDEYHANLLPEQKVEFLKQIKEDSKLTNIAMVGDGINDAAGLSIADIGITMGGIGSDVAIESGDIVIMDDNLAKIYSLIKLSGFIKQIVYGNFFIWGMVNIIGLGLVFGGVLNPASAAFYNFITDFIPLINAFRVFRYKARH